MVLFCPSTALIALLETNVLKVMLAAKLVAPRPASNTLKRNKLLLAIFTPPRVWCRLSFDKWCDYIRFRLPAKSRNTVKQYRTVRFFTDTPPPTPMIPVPALGPLRWKCGPTVSLSGGPGSSPPFSILNLLRSQHHDHRRSRPDRGTHLSRAAPHAEPGGGREPHTGGQFLHRQRDPGAQRRASAVAQPGAGRGLLHHRRHGRNVPGRGAHDAAHRAGSLHSAPGVPPVDQHRRHAVAHALLLRAGRRRGPLAPGARRHAPARRRRCPGASRRSAPAVHRETQTLSRFHERTNHPLRRHHHERRHRTHGAEPAPAALHLRHHEAGRRA